MTQPAAAEFDFQVQAVWPEGLAEAAQVANQFAVSNDVASPDGVYLLVGHLAMPVFLSPEQALQRVAQLGNSVTIAPRGSFYMTRHHAAQLRDLLDRHLSKGTPHRTPPGETE